MIARVRRLARRSLQINVGLVCEDAIEFSASIRSVWTEGGSVLCKSIQIQVCYIIKGEFVCRVVINSSSEYQAKQLTRAQ